MDEPGIMDELQELETLVIMYVKNHRLYNYSHTVSQVNVLFWSAKGNTTLITNIIVEPTQDEMWKIK